jgi:hypothetical protein
MSFSCYRCSKTFNQKIHLINHLQKKNLCPPNTADISPSVLLDELLNKKGNKDNIASVQQNDTIVENSSPTPTINNSGGINIFILPGYTGDTKVISSTNFNDVGHAINSILGIIMNRNKNNDGVKNINLT